MFSACHSAYFHGNTWCTMDLPPVSSQYTSDLMWLRNARHHLTRLELRMGSMVLVSHISHSSLSSHASSIMKQQPWQWMWMTSELSELRELSEVTRFIASVKPTYNSFARS